MRSKVAAFAVLVLLIEAALYGFSLHDNLAAQALALFPTILVGFGLWHHDKGVVLAVGFTILLGLFLVTPRIISDHHNGPPDNDVQPVKPWISGYLNHFQDPHRAEVVFNLAYLLLGFALFSRYFEKSGLALAAARGIMSEVKGLGWMPPLARLLFFTYVLSIFLDNIAAALVAGIILKMMYKQQPVPFLLYPAIIGASNLGGAASFIGDTTTTLLYISGVSPMSLAKGFVGTALGQVSLVIWALWAVRGGEPKPDALEAHTSDADHAPAATSTLQWATFGIVTGGCVFLQFQTGAGLLVLLALTFIQEARRLLRHIQEEAPSVHLGSGINWPQLCPLLGIIGLVVGNLAYGQPGLGLWAGLIVGTVIGRIWSSLTGKTPVRLEVDAVIGAVPGTIFLVLLVASAKLLPLEVVKPAMQQADTTMVTYSLGVASAIFDNIPLTSIAIQLGGFEWALLSYAVGFGGSLIWLGSSAGVALGTIFPQVYDTRRWLKPGIALFGVYNVGFFAILGFWGYLIPTVQAWQPDRFTQVMLWFAGVFACWAAAGCIYRTEEQKVGPLGKACVVMLGLAGAICLLCTFFAMAR